MPSISTLSSERQCVRILSRLEVFDADAIDTPMGCEIPRLILRRRNLEHHRSGSEVTFWSPSVCAAGRTPKYFFDQHLLKRSYTSDMKPPQAA